MDKPRSLWTSIFTEEDGHTIVMITIKHETLDDLETIIGMGFREGFTMALGNLDELLSTLNK